MCARTYRHSEYRLFANKNFGDSGIRTINAISVIIFTKSMKILMKIVYLVVIAIAEAVIRANPLLA
jgi:hypothetical protein